MVKASIEIDGAKELRRQMKRAGREDLKIALRTAHRNIAKDIAGDAARRAPHKSGKLANSIRGLGTYTNARIAGGTARVPYAGPIHWGWPARNIAPNTFVSDAVADRMDEARAFYEDAIEHISKQLHSGAR